MDTLGFFFFKRSWETIKDDLMQAVQYFSHLHEQHFSHLNTAHIILIPKKADAKTVGGVSDNQFISLSGKVVLQAPIQ